MYVRPACTHTMINATVFNPQNQTQTQTYGQTDPADIIAAYIILIWIVGIAVFTMTAGYPPRPQAQVPPQSQIQPVTPDWNLVGVYNLHTPQTLTKAEREALDAVGGDSAVFLYERKYPTGNVAWRYHVGDTTFYPKERNVRRRGMDLWGNMIEQ